MKIKLNSGEPFSIERESTSIDLLSDPIFDGIEGFFVNRYTVCSTAANEAVKSVYIRGVSEIKDGLILFVNFENTNSSESPKLNINGLGAKSIGYNGSVITDEVQALSKLSGLCEFIYISNCNCFQLINQTFLAVEQQQQGIVDISPSLPWNASTTGTVTLNDSTNVQELVEHLKARYNFGGSILNAYVINKDGGAVFYADGPGTLASITIYGNTLTIPPLGYPYIENITWE